MDINLKVKIYLENEKDKFMGIGVLWLLQKIEQKKSLRAAAAELGISYTKAFNMIKNLEQALDCQILERHRGGQNRDGSILTPFALEFIKLYDDFQNQCKDLLKKPFDKFSQKLNKLCC